MIILLTVIHVLVCFFLVVVVLLQSGKAADLAGAFGGMGSQTAFGPRGAATVLSKATTVAAALFMVTSMSLAIVGSKSAGTGSTVLERQASKPLTKQAPGQPVPGMPGGQPSVTLGTEGGGQQTIPIQIPPNPAQTSAPPAQQQSAPAKK